MSLSPEDIRVLVRELLDPIRKDIRELQHELGVLLEDHGIAPPERWR